MEGGVFGNFDLKWWGGMEMFVAAIAAILSVPLLPRIVRLTRFFGQRRRQRLAPGPRGWPLLGSLPHLGEFPHKSLFEMSKRYGPVMSVRLGSVSALVISNGEMAKEVLHTNDQIFASRPELLVLSIYTYGGQDIAFAPYGPHWRQARKVATSQLLTSSRLARFTKIVRGEILKTIHTILEQAQSGGEENVDVSAELSCMTMDIITQMMWKKSHSKTRGNLSDENFGELVKKAMALAGSNNPADFLPSCLKSFAMRLLGLDRKVADIYTEFDDFFESIIREGEQALSNETKVAADELEDDFVTVLLKLNNKSEGCHSISRETKKAILGNMIAAGTDTTSVIFEWTLAELLKHPNVMKKAQDELMAVVGEHRLVSESDIPHLKYLDAVVKEGLRKHSALPLGIPHFSLGDCKVGGYDVPANTTVFLNLFAIHRDSSVWEKPEDFNPDRFLNSEKDYKGRDYDFLPFGSGRRMCPGYNLASTVLHLGLAQLLHTMTWSLPKGQTPESVDMTEASGLSVVRATPLVVNAKPRLAHHVIYPAMA